MKRLLQWLFKSHIESHAAETAELKRALEEQSRRANALEATNAHLIGEVGRVWERLDESIKNERTVLRMQANLRTQGEHNFKAFPDAPGIPEEDLARPIKQPQPSFVQGSELVRRNMTGFVNHMREKEKAGERLPIPLHVLESLTL